MKSGAFILGLACALVAMLLLAFFLRLGQALLAADCKRDGFMWVDGVRYDCAPTKKEPRA